jgi:hypothetical protein
MRKIIIAATAAAIALAPLLFTTPVAHADACDQMEQSGAPAAMVQKCRSTMDAPGGSPNNGQAYVPGKAGNGSPCPPGQHVDISVYGQCDPD